MRFDSDKFCVQDKKRRNVLVPCDHGTMIVNRFDRTTDNVGQGAWILDHGNASTIEAHLTFGYIKRTDPIIIDVGANIGTYTTWVSQGFPKGKIYSIEPQRLVFQILCGNLAINNIENVYAHNIAFSDSNGFLNLQEPNYDQNNNFGGFSLVEQRISTSDNHVIVPVLTLDKFVGEYSIPCVDFIKLDCEGMDMKVLAGAIGAVSKFHPGLLIECTDDYSDIRDEVIDFLKPYGYKFSVHEKNIFCF